MKTKTLITLATSILSVTAFAVEPDFTCKNKIVVLHKPAANWSKLAQVLPRHLGFIAEQLKNGKLDFAGPMIDTSDEPTGGMAIYDGNDLKGVETLTQNDPLVTEGVVTYSAHSWVQCVLK